MTSTPWPALGPSYDAVAPAYQDRFLDELDGKARDRELLAAFAAALPADGPVLDLGCGPGQIGAAVRTSGRAVIGVDLSRAMAKLAATRLDGGVAGAVLRLPFATSRASGVVAFYSLIHLRRDELAAAVGEVARTLRPGGRVLAAFHEGEGEVRATEFLGAPVPFVATLFGLDELVGAFGAGGLRVELAERRPPYANEGDTVRLYVGATSP